MTHVGAGTIRDAFTGNSANVDFLGPLRSRCISCGPLCMTSASVNTLTVHDIVITGTITSSDPIVTVGPHTHVWIPDGPTQINVPGSHDVSISLATGSWEMEMLVVGTGADTGMVHAENFAHYRILASFRSSGTSITTVQVTTTDTVECGTMTMPGLTVPISFHDGGTELIVRITPIANSAWSMYARLVGAPTP